MTPLLAAAESGPANFVSLDVELGQWGVLLGLIVALLLVDLLVFHREAHEIATREAAIESAAWISIGLLFALGRVVVVRRSPPPASTTPATSSRRASASTTCSCGR